MRGRVWVGLTASLLLTLFLAACASLSKEECRSGDWHTIGVTDGQKSQLRDRIAKHQKACDRMDITPDIKAWNAGREKGLLNYCTPQNAYSIAKWGGTVNPICTPAQARTLAQAYAVGQRYYEIGEDISAANSDISEIDTTLREFSSDLSYEDAQRKNRLRGERLRLQNQIHRLESSRLPFAAWPLSSR